MAAPQGQRPNPTQSTFQERKHEKPHFVLGTPHNANARCGIPITIILFIQFEPSTKGSKASWKMLLSTSRMDRNILVGN